MSAKSMLFLLFIVVLAGMLALLAMEAAPVRAQCGNPQPSTCTTCHAQQDPVNDKGEWHIIHARQDLCVNCHGGNASAKDKDLAHESLMAHPLEDIYTDCHSCHPDYATRAAQFAPILGVTPGSCATPTSVVIGNASGGLPPDNIITPANLNSAFPSPQHFLLISGGLALLIFFFFGLVWLDRHHA
jgi:hypothetical protein